MDRSIQPEIKSIDSFSIKLPQKTILNNGIELYTINAGEQEVVRVDILFKGGRWRQNYKLQSIFTNRMLKEGTKKFVSKEIAEKLDYYGAWLELSSSADYEYITLYSLNKYFKETLEVVESIIKEPTFPQNELETVISSNIQQFRINHSKVDFLSHRKLLNMMYGDSHPCGNLVIEDDYQLITADILRDFHTQNYSSENCTIFLSGKITNSIIQAIDHSFGNNEFGIHQRNEQLPVFSIHSDHEKRGGVELEGSTQSSVKLGSFTIKRSDADYLKYRVLIKLFGGYFGSRLMTNIREDKGYTYGISANTMFYPDSSILMISAETDHKYVEPLIHEIYREVNILQSERVSDEELSMVKNYMIGEMCRSYESSFSLADAWIFIHTYNLSNEYFKNAVDAILNTSSEDINHLAQKYLKTENFYEVISGKKLF